MNQGEIQREILKTLYSEWARGCHRVGLNYLAQKQNWEERELAKAVDYLEHKNLIKIVASDRHSRLTAAGILEAEESGIAPDELREEIGKRRTRILDKLGLGWDEHGPYHHIDVNEVIAACEASHECVDTCLEFLKELGYVEDVTVRTYRITSAGHERVQEWRKKVSLAEEFTGLSALAPQARGRQFQKLLARVLGEQGWRQKEGVRTSHEEMDVIIHREREYYLIECKWEKAPIEAKVIREFYGKLSNRTDVRGVVFSLSGFTEGAVTQVQEYINDKVILLFGKEDVEKVIRQAVSFDALLSEKYDEVVTRRKVIFE